MLDLAARRRVCQDTIERSPSIAESTPNSSLNSYFIPSQLPKLDKASAAFPDFPRSVVSIHNSDAFELSRKIKSSGKIGILNLASDREPGGGWVYSLSKTQEEALCYSSTLYATLKPEWYPYPNTGPGSCAGVFSPDVVVFKETLDKDCADLATDDRHVVAVITVAAPCQPQLTQDGQNFAKKSDVTDLREKIILVLRIAASSGVTSLVLGAMGCGAYGCPPQLVANEMKDVIEMEEFGGWFENIVFAVFGAGPVGRENFDTFKEVFQQE
ncbi:hypothetical protein IQ07DRAFT_394610 [Pyrenochaeta sp. DS3sAY3a]|nr:hypothetical protein IQ07DRAFT_394610 [Pyrenochaeta sp. DS3sAY3a]